MISMKYINVFVLVEIAVVFLSLSNTAHASGKENRKLLHQQSGSLDGCTRSGLLYRRGDSSKGRTRSGLLYKLTVQNPSPSPQGNTDPHGKKLSGESPAEFSLKSSSDNKENRGPHGKNLLGGPTTTSLSGRSSRSSLESSGSSSGMSSGRFDEDETIDKIDWRKWDRRLTLALQILIFITLAFAYKIVLTFHDYMK